MIAAFSITPIGVGESVSELVAGCVGIVRASGLPNETNAMFANVEGEWDEVMRVIKQCVDHVAMAAPRVSVVVKIDHRSGGQRGVAFEGRVRRTATVVFVTSARTGPPRPRPRGSRSRRWFAGVSRSPAGGRRVRCGSRWAGTRMRG
jgi:uncharacterized protein (TIGR00106 family)